MGFPEGLDGRNQEGDVSSLVLAYVIDSLPDLVVVSVIHKLSLPVLGQTLLIEL